MSKKLKFMLVTLTICLLTFGLLSCDFKPADKVPDNKPAVVDENVIYSPYVSTTLVLGEGVDESDVKTLRTAYYKNVGKEITVGSSDKTASSHEIVIGKTEREVSKKAYRTLVLVNKTEEYIGYAIYSDGKSVAIAFDEARFGENVAFAEAIELFVSSYMTAPTLKLDEGNVYYDSFDPIQKQKERDNIRINDRWELKLSQISEKLGADEEGAKKIVDQLKKLRQMYNKDYSLVNWLANLYDPVSGGFYYSPSARNNEGFLPDLESTSQALSIVESILTGYDGTLINYFGEEVANKFVSFANGMQSSDNGYFYHPQWSRDAIDKNPEKRSRDMLNALNILNSFGASPTYDTPNGVKGNGTPTPVSKLTSPLNKNRVKAVASVVETEAGQIFIPAHLKSKETFETYLAGLDIKNNTVEVSETLLSEVYLYKAIDELLEEEGESYRLLTILGKYLEKNQNIGTGLWCPTRDKSYKEINELNSVIKLYSSIGRLLPCYETLVETVTNAIQSDTEPETINEIASMWTVLCAAVDNIKICSDDYEKEYLDSYFEYLYSLFENLLKKTQASLSYFVRDDGSFSTTPKGSLNESFGMPMAIPSMEEGDMNAALMAKNIWLAVFKVLDIGSVPIFNAADRMTFQKTLLDMGIIIKNEIIKTQPIDFEYSEIGSTDDVRLALTSSDSYAGVVFDTERNSKVLKLHSAKNSTWDQYFFNVTSAVNSASCLTYELDLCVLPGATEGAFAQLYIFADTYVIALNRDGDKIRFIEESSRSSAYSYTQDLGIRADIGEWVNLRVEYYPGTHETVRIKVFFNGECIAVTDNYFESPPIKFNGTGTPSSNYASFAVYGCPSKEMTLLVDNIITEKTYKTYTPETSSKLNRNVDTPDKAQTIHGFENTTVGVLPSGFVSSGSTSAVSVKADDDGNKVLSFSETGGELILPLDQRGLGINSAVIEFDLTVSSSSAVGAKYQISFNEYKYNERTFGAVQLLVLEEDGSKYAAFADVAAGKTGDVYSDLRLSLEVKHHVRFQIFFEECAVVTWIDGNLAGVNTNVTEGCKKYYMGETTIKAITPSIKSEILIDNLVSERVKSDFDEMTAPSVDRVTHTFDNTDGITASGIAPEGGVLSFAGLGVNEAYISVHVNNRVAVPTIALAGFDVVSAENARGNLIISFTDKSGNIISAFALSSLRDSIEIYEYTSNGKYKAPIHTVNKTSFNLSFEYGEKMKSFNILVDGEYVAASSLLYTKESIKYEFEEIRISSLGAADYSIDNLYIENTSGVFKGHTVSMDNADNTDAVMTYETSSFASMPTKLERHTGAPTTYFKITEGKVYGEITKVLEFNSGKGTANDHAIFGRTQTAQQANAAFFETDVMIETTEGLFSVLIEPRSRTMLAHAFSMQTDGTGQNITVLGDFGGDFRTTTDVKEGEWFKLRLEYANVSTERLIYRAYINGKLVGEGYSPRYTGEIPLYSDINQVRLTVSPGIAGRMYFDNTALGQFTMQYDESSVPNTQISGPQSMDELAPSGTLPSYLAIFNQQATGELLTEEGHGTYAKFTLPVRGDYIQFNPMDTGISAADATAFELEFDIKMKTPGKERYEKLELFFIDSKTNTALHDNLIYGRDNYTTDHLLIENNTFNPTKTFAGVETTEWFNIKMVMYKGDPNCYVYVNGDMENPFINTTLYGNSKDYTGDISRIVRARILLYDTRSLGSEICIDNVFCGYTKNTNPAK